MKVCWWLDAYNGLIVRDLKLVNRKFLHYYGSFGDGNLLFNNATSEVVADNLISNLGDKFVLLSGNDEFKEGCFGKWRESNSDSSVVELYDVCDSNFVNKENSFVFDNEVVDYGQIAFKGVKSDFHNIIKSDNYRPELMGVYKVRDRSSLHEFISDKLSPFGFDGTDSTLLRNDGINWCSVSGDVPVVNFYKSQVANSSNSIGLKKEDLVFLRSSSQTSSVGDDLVSLSDILDGGSF